MSKLILWKSGICLIHILTEDSYQYSLAHTICRHWRRVWRSRDRERNLWRKNFSGRSQAAWTPPTHLRVAAPLLVRTLWQATSGFSLHTWHTNQMRTNLILRRLSDKKRQSMGGSGRRSRLFSGTASPDFLKAVSEIKTLDNVWGLFYPVQEKN